MCSGTKLLQRSDLDLLPAGSLVLFAGSGVLRSGPKLLSLIVGIPARRPRDKKSKSPRLVRTSLGFLLRVGQPLMTPIGFMRATFFDRPAAWTTSTTMFTSL